MMRARFARLRPLVRLGASEKGLDELVANRYPLEASKIGTFRFADHDFSHC